MKNWKIQETNFLKPGFDIVCVDCRVLVQNIFTTIHALKPEG